MHYALAKELAEAGFPQAGNGGRIGPPDRLVWRRDDRVYAPTLAELIGACGGRLTLLWREDEHAWHAISGRLAGDRIVRTLEASSSSAEEAVARLWLALAQARG